MTRRQAIKAAVVAGLGAALVGHGTRPRSIIYAYATGTQKTDDEQAELACAALMQHVGRLQRDQQVSLELIGADGRGESGEVANHYRFVSPPGDGRVAVERGPAAIEIRDHPLYVCGITTAKLTLTV